MKKILVATALTTPENTLFSRGMQMAEKYAARLHVVHVMAAMPRGAAVQEEEKAFLKIKSLIDSGRRKVSKVTARILRGKAHKLLLAEIEKFRPNLVVCGAHRKNLFKDFVFKSTAETLLGFSNAPLLLVRNKTVRDYKKVVVAVDFSDHSVKALEMAVKLFPGEKIHVVNAYTLPFSGLIQDKDLEAFVLDQQKEAMDVVLKKLARKWRGNTAKIMRHVHIEMIAARPDVALNRKISTLKADMLMIGAHGKPGLLKGIIGSTTEEMIRNADCDVLIVR